MTQPLSLPIGSRYGAWTVIGAPSRGKHGRWVTPCRCDCGREGTPQSSELKGDRSQRCLSCKSQTHGATRGGRKTREFRCWSSMLARCYQSNNASYPNYGGRGIAVVPQWRSRRGGFEAFLAHIGPAPTERHTIDRIDSSRGYEPGNVRWATMREQGRNMRSNRNIAAFGKTLCLRDWASETGLHEKTIHYRLRKGMSAEDALSRPRFKRRPS